MKISSKEKTVVLGEKDAALIGRDGGEMELFVPNDKAFDIAPVYLEFIVGCGLLSADPKFIQTVCKIVKETMKNYTPSNTVMN